MVKAEARQHQPPAGVSAIFADCFYGVVLGMFAGPIASAIYWISQHGPPVPDSYSVFWMVKGMAVGAIANSLLLIPIRGVRLRWKVLKFEAILLLILFVLVAITMVLSLTA